MSDYRTACWFDACGLSSLFNCAHYTNQLILKEILTTRHEQSFSGTPIALLAGQTKGAPRLQMLIFEETETVTKLRTILNRLRISFQSESSGDAQEDAGQSYEKSAYEAFVSAPGKTGTWSKGTKLLGRYEIVQIVQKGGMGLVYLCYDHKYKLPVAIKTLKEPTTGHNNYEALLEKFRLEAEAWIRLEKHKNIVQAKGVEMVDDRPMILMEYVNAHERYGADLRGRLNAKGRLDLDQCLRFAIQVCAGMEHAEMTFTRMKKPFVHRDIKPDNIMVTPDDVIKITDFGLVKIFDQDQEDMFASAGTPGYMPPEQWKGKKDLDVRSDIYAFGCMLYEMLSGKTPFQGENIAQYCHGHFHESPQPLQKTLPHVPARLNELILTSLEKDREKRRPDSFSTWKFALQEIYHDLTGQWPREERPDELEAWEYLSKGISLCKLGFRKDAVQDFNHAQVEDPGIVHRFIPRDVAKVYDAWCPEQIEGRRVFVVLSHFSNLTAQESIAKTLDLLVHRYGARLICLEGGSGKIDLSSYRNVKERKRKIETAHYFLRQARISGAEFFAVTTETDVLLYGAEDQALYDGNVAAFKGTLKDKAKRVRWCDDILDALDTLKPYVYSENLVRLDQQLYSLKKNDLAAYHAFLDARLKTMGTTKRFPHMEKQMEAVLLGRQIDAAGMNREQNAALIHLVNYLDEEKKGALARAIQEFKRKDITEKEFYPLFKQLILANCPEGFLEQHKNLNLFIQRIEYLCEVQVVALFHEFEEAERTLREALYTGEDERLLGNFIMIAELMKQFYATHLLPDKVAVLNSHATGSWGKDLVAFILRQAETHGLLIVDSETAFEHLAPGKKGVVVPDAALSLVEEPSPWGDFYRRAEQRSKALIKNCLSLMDETGESSAVLVVGGFHENAVKKYLKQIGVAFLVHLPRYAPSADDDRRYEDALMDKKSPLEEAVGNGVGDLGNGK